MWKGKTGSLKYDPKLITIYIRMTNKIFSIIALMIIMSGLTPLCTNIYQVITVIVLSFGMSIYQLIKLYKIMIFEYISYLFDGN